MERSAADLQHSGRCQDERGHLGRAATLSKATGERSRAGQRRGYLVRGSPRPLWRAGVAARRAAHPALSADADRDPGDSHRQIVSGTISSRLEPPPMIKDRRVSLGAALAIIALPAAIVPIQAVSFYSANRDNGSFISSGEKREYLLYVPRSYDRTRPTPLVISMHGAGLWGASQRDISRWNDLADVKGFIVVYPSGVGGKGVRIWRAERGEGLPKDVKFISALIDTLGVHYNIDPTRIYANGLSNGGGM